MPVNWYAALVVIVILGIVSIVFARHEYQHPHKATVVQPAVGKTLYAGLAINICGTVLPSLPASTNTSLAGVTTPGEDVLNASPKTTAQAGDNANLGAFFDKYPKSKLTSNRLELSGKSYVNGQMCAAGTPDAGKKGFVTARAWSNALSNASTVVPGNPASFKIPSRGVITVGFVPKGTTLKKPGQSVINAVIALGSTVLNGTTTTVPPSTTTTVPSTTTTTVPSTTTTAPGGTTTTG